MVRLGASDGFTARRAGLVPLERPSDAPRAHAAGGITRSVTLDAPPLPVCKQECGSFQGAQKTHGELILRSGKHLCWHGTRAREFS